MDAMMKILMDKFDHKDEEQQQKDLQHIQEIQTLQTQIGQLSNAPSNVYSQGLGKLPSQVVTNPNVGTHQNPNIGGVNAISLRHGKIILSANPVATNTLKDKEVVDDSPFTSTLQDQSTLLKAQVIPHEEEKDEEGQQVIKQALLFPTVVAKAKRRKKEAAIFTKVYDIFKMVVISVPLVDLVAQVPKYAKFLKELCTTKRKLKHKGKVDLGVVVSSLYQMSMLVKCKELGSFFSYLALLVTLDS